MAPVDVSMRPGERIELPTSVDIRSSTDITHVGTVGQHHCCPVTVQAASLPQNGTLRITLTTNEVAKVARGDPIGLLFIPHPTCICHA